MTRNLRKRIQALESRIPTESARALDFWRRFLLLAIGCYLAGGDRLTKGQRRQILCVVTNDTWAEGLTAEELQDRWHQRPYIELFEKFGVSWNDELAAVFEAFERMVNGFSEPYRDDLLELLEEYGFASVKSASDALMESISASA